jgi:hypothetical protein
MASADIDTATAPMLISVGVSTLQLQSSAAAGSTHHCLLSHRHFDQSDGLNGHGQVADRWYSGTNQLLHRQVGHVAHLDAGEIEFLRRAGLPNAEGLLDNPA